MQTIRVHTTQNVSIQYPLASLGDRLLAYIIDQFILFFYAYAAILLLDKLLYTDNWWVFFLIAGVPLIFYSLAFELLMNGQSPGKMAMRIRVIRLDGTPPGVGNYLMRWVFRFVDFGISGGAVAMISIASSKNGQRIGDMVAGTSVIKVAAKEEITSEEVFVTPDENYVPTFTEVTNLSTRDIELVQRALEVNRKHGNSQPAIVASGKIKAVLGIESEMPPIKFLYTIVQDYNHLTSQPA
ncbi:MAG TPA: RDD family protein [Ohtaekwangia sp.]|nr:RDD family protein [Ohtaekwangia sp.]